MASDTNLLQAYARTRDADAFAELVRTHAGIVYGTCLRITGSPHDAEDIAQECFMELARSAGVITSSLSGWLHTVATHRSLNSLRNAATRRHYETLAMPTQSPNDATWQELAPHVDQALSELPDPLRVPLLLHFLQSRSQSDIAAQLGRSQATISRQINKGLKLVRSRLKKAGIVASVATMTALLTENAASAAPGQLITALSKMAIAGLGQATATTTAAAATAATTAGATAAGAFLATTTGRIVLTAAIGIAAVGGTVAYKQISYPAQDIIMAQRTLKNGFRYDPMSFVENDETLAGALVRKDVFNEPKPGDAQLLQAEIDKILADQFEDGAFGDTSRATAEKLIGLLDLGASPSHPSVARAAAAMLAQYRDGRNPNEWYERDGALPWPVLQALGLLDMHDTPEITTSISWLVDHSDQWLGYEQGCPWTPICFLKALWDNRDVVDATDTITAGLKEIADDLNDAGCLSYNDPWGFLDCAGYVVLPVGRQLVLKQLPLILRAQQRDGGWGHRSLTVLRALVKHDLLDEFRTLKPLPPDWKVARSFPTPDGSHTRMAWDGNRFWLYDQQTHEAVAVSSSHGKVARRLKLPEGNVRGLGWWDDALAVTQGDPWQKDPRRLLQIDPDTGSIMRQISFDDPKFMPIGEIHLNGVAQVGERIWVIDSFFGHVHSIDPDNTDDHRWFSLSGPLPTWIAPHDDAVWHCDLWAPYIMKNDRNGQLLDWGEKPFEGQCDGLAWDGQSLWALDSASQRICMIEKNRPLAQDETAGHVTRQDP